MYQLLMARRRFFPDTIEGDIGNMLHQMCHEFARSDASRFSVDEMTDQINVYRNTSDRLELIAVYMAA